MSSGGTAEPAGDEATTPEVITKDTSEGKKNEKKKQGEQEEEQVIIISGKVIGEATEINLT